ncbi:MAG: methyltransferase domain-containing protein [Deltaproteobacteria bacterium]|nr:methyltransferase domain-containing protein [Deltaproteobacteria bacterium]
MSDLLRPEVGCALVGARASLWQSWTGRHAEVSAAALRELEEGSPLWTRLAALQMVGEVDYPRLWVARSRLPLYLPAERTLWYPLPSQRTAGGHRWGQRVFSVDQAALWEATLEQRPVERLAARVGLTVEEVLAWVRGLTGREVQVLQLRPAPAHARDLSLERLVAPPRPVGRRPTGQLGAAGETQLGAYHQDLEDPESHFDDRETTVAHALATPHQALGGSPYGARLRARLELRGMVPGDGLTVEVGCGTGELARDWRAAGAPARYLRVDRSPALLQAQARMAPGSLGVLGDATALPLGDASVDLLISNEVLADLPAVPWPETSPHPEVEDRIRRYGLALGPGWKNLGAWRMVEEVARVLRPGGWAWMSEFGALDEAPQETEQLDHPEVSIQFGDLRAVAEALGLQAEVVRLDDALGMDLGARWVARSVWEGARAVASARGTRLKARAWTAQALEAALGVRVQGLREVPLSEPGPGPLPTRFFVLVVRRPVEGAVDLGAGSPRACS